MINNLGVLQILIWINIYIFRENNKISCGRKVNKKGLLIK